MRKYKVKNWHDFQHYHKPRPLWIKLHRTLLDDHEFQSLEPSSRALLVMLWLLAAESKDGTIPDHAAIAWRLRMKEKEIDSQMPVLSHFIEEVYSESSEILASEEKRREERETERETEDSSKDDIKNKYLDFVMLTNSELDDIYLKLGNNADSYIERLNGYLGQTGKKYKSHYHTILNWWRKDVADGKVISTANGDPF